MTEVKIQTNIELLKRLEESAKRKLTEAEIEKQRVSIIFSGMPKKSGMSRVDIERALQKAS